MRLHLSLATLFLAGLLLGNPIRGLANDEFLRPMNPEIGATHEKIKESPSQGSIQQRSMAEPSEIAPVGSFDMASVDYCYRGSIVDPATGETVDLFAMCTEGEVGNGLDVA